ncbi:hypothetical protein [Desulfobacter vibrioformis]|uniref:hypothetical protein n=1 Tax=Desulfobacter vibrioformis TaxID=34031 RepID=UPI000551BC0D|nr:hypothetical protein [Desulfobacter vibrioformis]
MPISGNISSRTFDAERAGIPMAPVNVQPVPLESDDAVWPCGLVLGKDADGKFLPYAGLTEQIGTGDGTEKAFTGQVGPIEPGSAEVTAESITLDDDGCGNLAGTGGAGSINYQTGKVVVGFTAAPANAAAVELDYSPDPVAVLDAETDTSDMDVSNAVVFGAVKKSALKVGVTAQTAAGDAVVERLRQRHIHAV